MKNVALIKIPSTLRGPTIVKLAPPAPRKGEISYTDLLDRRRRDIDYLRGADRYDYGD